METEGLKKPKKARRKKRKSSPRPSRYRGRLKRPGTSAGLKAHWDDPVWRAQMVEKRKLAGLKLRGCAARTGVPDGMRKAEAYPLCAAAKESAKETMSELKQSGVLGDLDPRAEEALESAIEVMRKPGSKTVQLSAARLVLEWTKAKPASKSEISVNKAEEWLKAVTEQDGSGTGEAPTDA